jgi:nitrogen fixation/metabolism regulation signal transduction histidine kinase
MPRGLRARLLLAFSVTTLVAVAIVVAVSTQLVGDSFERREQERIDQALAQVRAQIARRGEQAARRVAAAAESEAVTRIAIAVNQTETLPPAGMFLTEATALARSYDLDFLQLVTSAGVVISSAQWDARAGARDPDVARVLARREPFVRLEETPAGGSPAIEAAHEVALGFRKLYLIGGYRLEAALPADAAAAGLERVALFQPAKAEGMDPDLRRHAERALPSGREYRAEERGATVAVMPVLDASQQPLAALVMTVSGAERQRVIRFLYLAAVAAGALGLLAALPLSIALAGRITQPVAELVGAAHQIAAGNLEHRIPERPETSAEMARLSQAFNQMAADLREHRERLMQVERVAAWRELARRLAHELKNPLFPLQLSIENLRRAREADPQNFDEVFEEATTTLLAELEELKRIVGRFSDFARMPKPELAPVDLRSVLDRARRLYESRIAEQNVQVEMRGAEQPVMAQADAQLLSQAVGNLVLNALDAMPAGGRLELAARHSNGHAVLEVADSGKGISEEERSRLFTPYYTTKLHGTGLGLAIVQSVVADHGGRITVESAPEKGTRFRIEL